MANPYTTTFRPYVGSEDETYASYNPFSYSTQQNNLSNPYQQPTQAYAPQGGGYIDNSYNAFRNERDPRNSDSDRSSYGITRRDLPTGGGNVDLTSGDGFISYRDLPGAIGGLFGTPGAVIGSAIGEAIRPGGFGSVNTTNIPGFGPVASDLGPLAPFRAAIPGAAFADATLGAAARQTIQDVLNTGIGLSSAYGPGRLAVYDPRTGVSSFGLNPAQTSDFQKYAPAAYREKQRQLSARGIDQTPGFGSSAGNTAVGGDIRFSDIRNFNAGQPQQSIQGGQLFGGGLRGAISAKPQNVNAQVTQRPYEGERIGAVPVPRVDVQRLEPVAQQRDAGREARAAAADRASASRNRTAAARDRGNDRGSGGGSRGGGRRNE